MNKEELRTRIEAELLVGTSPKDLETKYGIPYVTINGWKNKLNKSTDSEISELTNHTKATLEIVRARAKEEAPKVAGKIDKIIDGVEGLQELEPEFQRAMHKAVELAHTFLGEVDDDGKSALTIKEWQMITTTLASAYSAMFNKAGTTVNVAQTNVNAAAEQLSFFKASQRAI